MWCEGSAVAKAGKIRLYKRGPEASESANAQPPQSA
jgi:hypothetical protein